MKVYVDANDIGKTVTYKEENGVRQYLYVHDKEGFIFKDLADHTKQVRKEVLSELMNMLGDRAELIDCGGVAEFMFTTYDLSMCVEEILGEEKGESSEQ